MPAAAALPATVGAWLTPRRMSWMTSRKKPAMERKRAAWPRWGMRTGGSGGGVPSALGKKRVWSSGLTGGRKTGTVTAGSSLGEGRAGGGLGGGAPILFFRVGVHLLG